MNIRSGDKVTIKLGSGWGRPTDASDRTEFIVALLPEQMEALGLVEPDRRLFLLINHMHGWFLRSRGSFNNVINAMEHDSNLPAEIKKAVCHIKTGWRGWWIDREYIALARDYYEINDI